MSEKQLKAFLETMERVRQSHGSTPEKARRMLVDAGFYTQDGEVTKHSRRVEVPAEAQGTPKTLSPRSR